MAKSYTFGSKEHKYFMYHNAKNRAKHQGIKFSLELDDLNIPETCPVLGIPMAVAQRSGGNSNSPTLDRLCPDLGYTADNIAVISMKANRMKSDCSPEEMMKVAMWSQRKIGRMEAVNGAL